MKKDININCSKEKIILRPADGLEKVRSTLNMFLKLADHDMIEFLTIQ